MRPARPFHLCDGRKIHAKKSPRKKAKEKQDKTFDSYLKKSGEQSWKKIKTLTFRPSRFLFKRKRILSQKNPVLADLIPNSDRMWFDPILRKTERGEDKNRNPQSLLDYHQQYSRTSRRRWLQTVGQMRSPTGGRRWHCSVGTQAIVRRNRGGLLDLRSLDESESWFALAGRLGCGLRKEVG